ncbi:MAG: hypothetical protein IM568_07780 [Flavobacterium sp.]|nr:hypothetical protein [Flavobacterium sp.]
MEEKQLEILFKQFLLTKGYPQGSLLSQVALRTTGDGTFRPDLVILDIDNKEYIGLVEFKNKVDKRIEVNTLGQFYKYFSLLGTQAIPAYLVFPISEEDFQILALNKDNTFEPISKEDFPIFETLSAKRLTEEKIKQREVEEKTLAELEQKKKRTKQSAYLTLLSLILGISASVIAVFIQQKGFDKPSSQTIICCDSLEFKFQNLEQKINTLEKQFNVVSKPNNKTDTVYVNSNVTLLEKRIKIIELGISENPEKTLSILQIRQEIELLKKADDYAKELTQTKIDAIKDEMEVQNAWMLGVLIAIFGTILSLVIPNLITKRNVQNIEP